MEDLQNSESFFPTAPRTTRETHNNLAFTKMQVMRRPTTTSIMKFAAALIALAGSAAAFAPVSMPKSSTALNVAIEELPGALPPMGIWDPFGLAEKADSNTLKRYREAEVTHGRVAMLATLGFLAGEAVEGKSFLWDASVTGPAIGHLQQVPPVFWALLVIGIGAAEQTRAEIGWVEPENVPVDQPGLLREVTCHFA